MRKSILTLAAALAAVITALTATMPAGATPAVIDGYPAGYGASFDASKQTFAVTEQVANLECGASNTAPWSPSSV